MQAPVAFARMVKVRVPFKRSRKAWEYEGRRVFYDGAPGAVVLEAGHDGKPGTLLDLRSGAVYRDARF